ncbi:MAG TPA: iron ABC transporter permease [Candidatus Lustribacter sp.]|nr:iron ABC transporter permease [Candidatus Lustribacter sp.]
MGRAGRYALLGALVVLILYPASILLYLTFWSATPGAPGHFTLRWFHDAFTAPGFDRVLINTAVFALVKAALAAAIGGGLAFLVARTDLPARRTVAVLAAAPFFVPAILTALAWAIIANPKTGMIPGLNVYSIEGMIFQATPITAAMFFLLTVGAFGALNSEMEEAAQLCGATRLTILRTIVVPMVAPALTGAAILSVIRGLENFETPYLLGSPGGVFVLSTEIYRYVRLDTPPEPGNAGALSLGILALTCVLMLWQWKYLAHRSFVTVTGRATMNRPIALGRWRGPLFALVVIYVGLTLGVPLAFLVASSFTSVFGVFSPSYLTTNNWSALLRNAPLWRAYVATLVVAFASGGIGVVVAGFVAYIRVRSSWWGGKVMDALTWIPWAMPGLVLALAFLWAAILMPSAINIYGTVQLLIVAFVVSSLPVGVRVMFGNIVQISPQLEEAARVSGASSGRAVREIVVPMLGLGALGAWVIIAYGIIGNLTLPVLLSAPGTELLSTQLLQIYSQGQTSQAAALAIVMLLTMAAVLAAAAIVRNAWRSYGRATVQVPPNETSPLPLV